MDRSLIVKHRTVNADNTGSIPVGPPRSEFQISNLRSEINSHGTVAERRMHFAVDEDDDGSSPFGPANFIMDV